MTPTKRTDAVAVIGEASYPMLAPTAVASVSELLSQVDRFDLLQLTVPAGGGLMWELPNLMGEVVGAPSLNAIICVLKGKQRKYWASGFGEGAKGPPDCSSSDGTTGKGAPGGECVACPHDQFRETGAPGKDCSTFASAYLFREGGRMPMLLNIPERSHKGMKQYLMGLADMGVATSEVVTKLGLEKATSLGGVAYTKVTFAPVARIEGEENLERARKMHAALAAFADRN